MLKKKDLINYFFKGIKKEDQLKIGVEHEKFILNKHTLKPVSYEEKGGIKDIFKSLISLGWKPITEESKEKIVALNRDSEYITLEPGGQIELSGAQLKTVHQTCSETNNHLYELKKLSEEFNFVLLGIGVEPELSINDFPWVPKERYSIMRKYMSKVGELGHHMMLRTCSSQVNLDYLSEKDMVNKFRILLNFESIGTAIFANSPFDKGKLSSYKSLRSYFWQHTDKSRTGITPFVFKENFNFEVYTDYALNVPMYFIKRQNKYIDMTGITFNEYLMKNQSKDGKKYEPNIEDWNDHITTLFPQIRLKQYLEIRSMDSCSWDLVCAPAAFWTGILYDDQSLDEANNIVSKWTDEDRMNLYMNVPKYGLNTKIRDLSVLKIAKELLKLSESGLNRRNYLSKNKEFNEANYLIDIKKYIYNGVSPADLLIEKYKGEWQNSLSPLYKELIF